MFEFSQRISQLPPYLFAQIDKKKREKIAQGVDVIDLGVGDPDIPTPKPIVDAMKRAVEKPEHHRYPSYEGMLSFRQAVADWYKRRFGVELDPEKEVITLIGSKEGIAHFPLAFVNPGDVVLCPDPAYPVYKIGTIFAGGIPYILPLKEENNFLPDFKSVPSDVLKKAKIIWVNYPNNPTSATATREFYKELIDWAREHNIIVASDLAYSEIYFDGEKPPSILEIEGAKDVAIEFHSLSKTFNMTGWRLGMAVGNEKTHSRAWKGKDQRGLWAVPSYPRSRHYRFKPSRGGNSKAKGHIQGKKGSDDQSPQGGRLGGLSFQCHLLPLGEGAKGF
jgi:LL-diaminopimelate aminotransferase